MANTRTFAGSPSFPVAAKVTLADPQLRTNLARATTTIREKRNLRVSEVPAWEDLRLAGEAIKSTSLAHLSALLEEFETNLTRAGGVVHWARDAKEARRIITELVAATGAHDVVKVKSMTSTEINLNGALEDAGVTAYETDLAELIVQLGDDLPSHIVVPAIHRSRDDVRTIFLDHMGEWGLPAPKNLTNAPNDLATAARQHLRQRFFSSQVGISGANFLVAETGSVVIVESEGNGRMCLTLPSTLITVAGIDKIVPRFDDLDVFFQVLPRSATGERMNPYTSVWTGVTPGDGPREFHVVLLDNGRSSALADRVGREALRCIRCAACLNVCPVYEKVGGHAYGSVYPGPIGAVLTPQLNHVATDDVATSLPYASTLCGACFDACPVRIDIPRLLVHLRGEIVDDARTLVPTTQEKVVMRAASTLFSRPALLREVTRFGAALSRVTKGRSPRLPGWLRGWSSSRATPLPKEESFSSWWRRTRPSSLIPRSDEARPRVAHRYPRRVPTALGLLPDEPVSLATSAKAAVLSSINAANAHAPALDPVPRAYRTAPRTTASLIDHFAERVADYQARVAVATPATLAESVAAALSARGSTSVVVAAGAPTSWLESYDGAVHVDENLSVDALDAIDAVVSGCAAAIAETGTVVLNNGPDQGRRLISLIPDHLVVIVREEQIVADVPDVMNLLDPLLPQTWISGPSATSDIELDRVEGVHGPRQLDVIILRAG